MSLATEPDWRTRAACRDMPSDIFFPDVGYNNTGDLAHKTCQGCPVSAECLDYAMSFGALYGIWGGTNVKQRRKLRKQRRAAA